jgi:hypothetical protein
MLIIDEVDLILTQYYDLTGNELDYIANYEIKDRIEASDAEDDDGA